MEVSIQHIIGTITLLGLVISVGFAYGIITDSLQTDIRKQQLQQVSEYVALNLVEIIRLDAFSNSIGNITRILDLPLELTGKTYIVTIELVNDTQQTNQLYVVKSFLATSPYINATSPIPLQIDQAQVILDTSSYIYGGSGNTVVWASTGSGTIEAGLARLTGGL